MRVLFSSFVVSGGNIGVDFSTSASVPVESYILNGVNFSGAGTYLAGVLATDDKAQFFNCKGIQNSSSIANMYMKNNAVATDVLVQNDRYRVAGTTEINAIIQRFSHDLANNAVEYTSTISRIFKVLITGSLTSGQNNVIGCYIGILRSGNSINPTNDRVSESEVYVSASGTRPDTYAIQCLANLNQGDKVYMIVQNTTGTTDITVNFLNLVIEATSN
jgi:hypothetical protein